MGLTGPGTLLVAALGTLAAALIGWHRLGRPGSLIRHARAGAGTLVPLPVAGSRSGVRAGPATVYLPGQRWPGPPAAVDRIAGGPACVVRAMTGTTHADPRDVSR